MAVATVTLVAGAPPPPESPMFTASKPPSAIEATITTDIVMALNQLRLCIALTSVRTGEDGGCAWRRAARIRYARQT
ncbi:MAG: hypothetical protein F4X25_02195 [Chloroflexi bacterium]|nr:hypothetical protein [Chloroflexota bacterium]